MIAKMINNCYQIMSEMGQGGMVAAYLAWGKSEDNQKARKLLDKTLAELKNLGAEA